MCLLLIELLNIVLICDVCQVAYLLSELTKPLTLSFKLSHTVFTDINDSLNHVSSCCVLLLYCDLDNKSSTKILLITEI